MDNPDGKHVVIKNGQRVSAPTSQEEAQQIADRLNQLQEANGQKGEQGQATVKRNLHG